MSHLVLDFHCQDRVDIIAERLENILKDKTNKQADAYTALETAKKDYDEALKTHKEADAKETEREEKYKENHKTAEKKVQDKKEALDKVKEAIKAAQEAEDTSALDSLGKKLKSAIEEYNKAEKEKVKLESENEAAKGSFLAVNAFFALKREEYKNKSAAYQKACEEELKAQQDYDNRPINGANQKVITLNNQLVSGQGQMSLNMSNYTFTTNKGSSEKHNYKLSIQNLSLHKKMYQPTEILAVVNFQMNENGGDMVFIDSEVLEDTFKNCKVCVSSKDDSGKIGEVGNDYYVHEVHISYGADTIEVLLAIYSLDKLMTEKHYSEAFTAKRLVSEVVKKKKADYKAPYDDKIALSVKSDLQTLYDMEMLKEHIIPYMVQYNESFYDFLARTTNRYGEFLYYEGGKLNIGHATNKDVCIDITNYRKCTFFDFKNYTIDGDYEYEGNFDKGFLESYVQKDFWAPFGNLFYIGGKPEKVVMKVFSEFFKNDKTLPVFALGFLLDQGFDLATQNGFNGTMNKKLKELCFTDSMMTKNAERYGKHEFKGKSKDAVNLFSEISSPQGHRYAKIYKNILKNEIAASKKAVRLDFDTTFPSLQLGQIIKIKGSSKMYVVVEVIAKSNVPLEYGEDMMDRTYSSNDLPIYNYQIIAIPEVDGKFYPTVIPSGHVRHADQMTGTVTDVNDPANLNRARVLLNWQGDVKYTKTDTNANNYKLYGCTEETLEKSTPWLSWGSNVSGKELFMGRHFTGDKVYIGFIDGNVERPYVMGAEGGAPKADVHLETPGAHTFKLTDSPGGLSSFLMSFTPALNTVMGMIPSTAVGLTDFVGKWAGNEQDKKLRALAGNFELTDYYGVYKVSGSTDKREVAIASTWGTVKVNAFTGITISAPNGDVKIQGKNVAIEAGNNLTLTSGTNVGYKVWRKEKKGTSWANVIAADITGMVAKKLLDTLNIVDLGFVRSTIEIIMRPEEGCLTLKSNRFMKLEAGKDSCAYPADAFSSKSKEKQIAELTKAVKEKYNSTFEMSEGMTTLIQKCGSISNAFSQKYRSEYIKARRLRGELSGIFNNLVKLANPVEGSGITAQNNDFNAYYIELAKLLWKSDFKEIKEDDLGLDKNALSVDTSNLDTSVVPKCVTNLDSEAWTQKGIKSKHTPGESINKRKENIINKRKEVIAEMLAKANELGKQLAKLINIEVSHKEIYAQVPYFGNTRAPKGYEQMMINAFNKANFADLVFFKYTDNDARIGAKIQLHSKWGRKDCVKMTRIAILSLFKELGFTNDMLTPFNSKENIKNYLVDGKFYKVNNKYCDSWLYWVANITGFPAQDADHSVYVDALIKAGKGYLDSLLNIKNIFSDYGKWSEGKEGKILIASNNNTFKLEGQQITPISSLAPEYKSLMIDSEKLTAAEAGQYSSFLKAMKQELVKVK